MRLLLLVAAAMLFGCSTGMSYHPWDSAWNLGYTDVQLNENTYRVSYSGYNIPQSQCDEFALMRAAEIARTKGYKYFRIANSQQTASSQLVYIPGATQTAGTITPQGNTLRYAGTSRQVGGVVGTISRPVSTFTVELVRDNQDGKSDLVNAETVWASLSTKYR